jgi:HEAT repeat protein
LVSIGEGAVSSLIKALQDREDQVRWEAAKALVDIASPKAASALVATLRDEEGDVRWLAAEALIALGADAIEPLLQGLVEYPGSPFIRAGAHHVFHELVPGPLEELVLPVLVALDGPAPEDRAPVAAYESLEALRKGQSPESGTTPSAEPREDHAPRRPES